MPKCSRSKLRMQRNVTQAKRTKPICPSPSYIRANRGRESSPVTKHEVVVKAPSVEASQNPRMQAQHLAFGRFLASFADGNGP